MADTPTRPAGPPARTLTEALRLFDADALTRLLELRPDLAHPAPRNVAELSAGATATASVGRALDGLDAWRLVVAEALAALPDPATVTEVADLLGAGQAACAEAIADLRSRALLWGADAALHLVRAVRDQLGPYPGGLAPPSTRPIPATAIDDLLAEAGPQARAVVDRLLWHPAGTLNGAERRITAETARSPVDRLLVRGLLRPIATDSVLLPREVAWHLRGRVFTPEPVPTSPPALTPPAPTGPARDPAAVDRAAIGAAFELVHDVELIGHTLQATPHRLLRDGGVSRRDLSALGRAIDCDTVRAAFVLECSAAASLVAAGDSGRLLPTADFDRWAGEQPAGRWQTLVTAWRHCDRLPGAAAPPGSHPLGPDSATPAAATVRQRVIDLLAGVAVGTVIEAGDLRAALGWHLPRLARIGGIDLDVSLSWIWREVGWLGITSLGAVSGLARAAVAADTGPLPDRIAAAFPDQVERIVLQADLTAVVPGPMPYGLARDLRLLADQESRGGAAVFRFSESSVRRALDAGWGADEIQGWLTRHAVTAVPQPLAYLIDDAARKHGSIRVGPASTYLRITDPAQAAAIAGHPPSAALGLREVAPGVLVTLAEPAEVVEILRELGLSPAVEDTDGALLAAPDPPRARRRPARRSGSAEPAASTAARILAGETADRPATRLD